MSGLESAPEGGPAPDEPSVADGGRRLSGRLTALQFIVFAGVAVIGLAALSAAGLAFGLALAGAAVAAVLALSVWVVAANLLGAERRGRPRGP